jgi:ribosomal protein S18 acetylase RimI-like enzyme
MTDVKLTGEPKLGSLLRVDESLIIQASFACQRAFQDDPVTAYLIPDPSKRNKQHYAFEFGLRLALAGQGEAYTTSINCEGVALWSPPEKNWSLTEEKQSLSIILSTGWPPLPLRCGWQHLWRDIKVNGFLSRIRRDHAPAQHIYLALLAVDPVFQGRGFASALLRPMTGRLDNEKLSCYLETQILKNVAMYQHFGFSLVHQTIIPGSNLPVYAMLRETS